MTFAKLYIESLHLMHIQYEKTLHNLKSFWRESNKVQIRRDIQWNTITTKLLDTILDETFLTKLRFVHTNK